MINRTSKLLLNKRAECKRLGEALQRAEARLVALQALTTTPLGYEIADSGAKEARAALATCGFKPLE